MKGVHVITEMEGIADKIDIATRKDQPLVTEQYKALAIGQP